MRARKDKSLDIKAAHKKLIDKSDSYIIVFNDHDRHTSIKHTEYNISPAEQIVALECVKHKLLYKHMVKR